MTPRLPLPLLLLPSRPLLSPLSSPSPPGAAATLSPAPSLFLLLAPRPFRATPSPSRALCVFPPLSPPLLPLGSPSFFALQTSRSEIQSFARSAVARVAHLAAIFIRDRSASLPPPLPSVFLVHVRGGFSRYFTFFFPRAPATLASFVISRYGFRELSAVSYHLSETRARARARARTCASCLPISIPLSFLI